MGTRGFITFAAGGVEKTAYNHWDSYPSGLGLVVLEFLREAVRQPEVLGAAVRALRVVSPDSKPSPEDVERFSKFSWSAQEHGGATDLRKGQEWYDLLHETQGKPGLILEAGVIEDASGFPLDSLFAEWGYVIDVDGDGWFEAYRGFQKSEHASGRFAARDDHLLAQEQEHEARNRSPRIGPYYPVALAARWPLTALPSKEEFLAALKEPDEDE